jgi:hypothetical protein
VMQFTFTRLACAAIMGLMLPVTLTTSRE